MVDTTQHIRDVLQARFPEFLSVDPAAWSMDKVPKWDSMAHVEIVVTLEQLFDIEADDHLVEAQSLSELVKAVDALRTKVHST